jgi:hypothetical protein
MILQIGFSLDIELKQKDISYYSNSLLYSAATGQFQAMSDTVFRGYLQTWLKIVGSVQAYR